MTIEKVNLKLSKNKVKFKKIVPALIGLTLFIFTLGLSLFYIDGEIDFLSLSIASGLVVSAGISFIALFSLLYSFRNAGAKAIAKKRSLNEIGRAHV